MTPFVRTRQVHVWLGGVAMILIGLAGLSKLADLPQFAHDLKTWSIFPAWTRSLAAVLVPVVEVCVAGAFLLRVRRRAMCAAAMALLAVFSAVYAAQWAWGGAPRCGCMGVIARQLWIAEEAGGVFLRNGVLMAMLIAFLILDAPARAPSPTRAARSDSEPPPAAAPGARAFTLIEISISIVVIALLLALLIPALSGVRAAGVRAATLSGLRQHAGVIALYAADYAGAVPYFSNPLGPKTTLHCAAIGEDFNTLYWGPTLFWTLALADGYYQGRCFDPSFTPPRARRGWDAAYLMSCTFMAEPAYWRRETREWPPAQLRGVRLADAVFPSAKCAFMEDFYEARNQWGEQQAPDCLMAMLDGHARAARPDQINEGMPSADGRYIDRYYTWHFADHWLAPLHTLDGIRGRDLR
ncbi:MAG: prepilin-type N-terminal cleavage/methylation domain-containing protein [Phycisphaerae bacterium]|nr:prepilin-type N-terminal cleavage/methylation domain-containing protein [Phycisphaerae bacterium]